MPASVREQTGAIAAGDAAALARFYEDWFDWMYALARRSTGRDESFCLDVVQDAMMRVIRSIRAMESEESLRAWLRRVVLTSAYDRIKGESRRAGREKLAAEQRRASAAAPGPAQDEERLAWLRAEIGSLDPTTAWMFVARHRFGWTLDRIGRAVGLKPGAVDGRMNRAASRLRERGEEVFHE